MTRSAGGRPGGHRLVGRWGTPGRAHPVAFIGRRPEIEILRSQLGHAMLGHGQIVMLVGEPGIGKSRLVQEFQQSTLAEGVLTREGRCAPYGTHVPYFPAIEIVQAMLVKELHPEDAVVAPPKNLRDISPLRLIKK